MSLRALVPILLALVLGLSALPAHAQVQRCGEIEIVFRNPDLQPGQDGLIRAQGQFFAQFQAIGAGADAIEVFGFSFGPATIPFGESACDAPVWFTGPYVINYRADRDPSDGFFVPLVTPLVPDGQYAAAVHAYDGNNNELARFWAYAIVDNCAGGDGSLCRDASDEHLGQDRTQPWPIILPGDGTPMEGKALTVEFGEPLQSFKALLNGADITAQMKEWEGREWDADYVPDYGPAGVGEAVAPPCSGAPGQTCMRYGPAYEWTGRSLTSSDVIRIEATDLAGNVAVKDVHIGSSVAGGAVTQDVPVISYTVDVQERTVAPGGSAVFRFTIQNNGAGTGHPFAEATAPEGWTHEWQPTHVPVEPGESKVQELVVTAPTAAATGAYAVNATLNYRAGGEERSLPQALTVLVATGGGAGQGAGGLASSTASGAPTEESPGLTTGLVAVAVALAVALRRRA